MTSSIGVTIDCADPQRLVRFWCPALGYVPKPPPDGHGSWLDYWRSIGIPEDDLVGATDEPEVIVDPEGRRPRIWFQLVPEPKQVKNRVHLDLDVTQGRTPPLSERRRIVEAEADRLVGLGAARLRTMAPEGADYYAIVLADPEGNEFCIS